MLAEQRYKILFIQYVKEHLILTFYTTSSEDSASITALLLENERLRTALKHEKLRAQAYDTMTDVAEEMFNIPIRKKAGTKQ